jgi:branched-chain amino acid transport system permease protein
VAWGAVLVVAAAATGPRLSVANLRTASHGMALAIIMLSLVLLTGYGGLVSLCQMTFVGLGSYAMAHAGGHGGSLLGLLAAAGLAAGFGIVVALPTLRLRGLYLALATLAFAQAMDTVFFNNVLGEGGAIRVARPHIPGVSRGDVAYFVELAVVFAAGGAAVLAVRRGGFGRRLAALADSPAACATLGLNINRTKLTVFTISAAMAGVGGALYSAVPGQASNNDFVLLLSLTLLLLVRIGGINTVSGAFLGAAFFTGFQILQSHNPSLTNIQYLLTGLGAIALGRDPNGMGGRVADAAAELRERLAHRPRRSEEASVAPA